MKQYVLNKLRNLIGIPQMKWEFTMALNRMQSQQRIMPLWEHILYDADLGITNQKYVDGEIIVSLTSYRRRLWDAAFAIETIMQQTMKANRIVLWLSHDDYKEIPQALKLLQKRGLEITECDDLLSYKKIIPSLRKFPNDVIVTIDDDVMYDPDVLERLIRAYLKAPQYIHACRVHRITFNENGQLAPYQNWRWTISTQGPHPLNFFTGCGGVLYPPHCLDEEAQNEAVFMKLCKTADDVWQNAMAIKKGTLVSKVNTHNPSGEDYCLNEIAQNESLYSVNVANQQLNDVAMKSVFAKYALVDVLKSKL